MLLGGFEHGPFSVPYVFGGLMVAGLLKALKATRVKTGMHGYQRLCLKSLMKQSLLL